MFKRQNSSTTSALRRNRRQRGFLMVEVTLALLLAGLAAALSFIATQRADEATSAMTQADNLIAIRDAAETLVQEQYIQYQAGQPITRNGVTLPAGNAPGQAFQPTSAILRTMGLGIDTAADQGFYKSLSNANYLITIRREPAGCELAPNPLNGSLCNITGLVCFDRPVQPYGAIPGGELDGFAVGKMLGKLGGNGGASIVGAEANIIGSGGSYTIPNPIGGAPAGIVCSRFGFGSAGFGNFLRVNDTRDPGFLGGATLGGLNSSANTLQVNGNAAITGTLNVGGASTFTALSTFNGGIESNGDVVVKDGGGTVCVRILRAGQIDVNCSGILNAKAGTFTGPLGVVRIGDTGTQYTIDTNGKVNGQQGFFAAVGSIFGDNTLGVRAAGGVFTVQTGAGVDAIAVHDSGRLGSRNSVASQSLGLSDPIVAGSACAGPSVEVAATAVTNPATTVLRALTGGGVASCVNGRWTAISQAATPGSACAPDGIQAISNVDGRGLSCKNGVFMQVNDLLSSFVLMATTRISFSGQIVTKPTCGQLGAGVGQAVPVLQAQIESSTNASFTRRTEDANFWQWRVILEDSNGNPLGGAPSAEALLMAYCYY